MHICNLVSLLGIGLALLSQSPPAFAAPIPSSVDSVVVKRAGGVCLLNGCRVAEPSNPDPTTQSTDLRLVGALIAALQSYREEYGPKSSDSHPSTDFSTPSEPSEEGSSTKDGSPAAAAIAKLVDDAL